MQFLGKKRGSGGRRRPRRWPFAAVLGSISLTALIGCYYYPEDFGLYPTSGGYYGPAQQHYHHPVYHDDHRHHKYHRPKYGKRPKYPKYPKRPKHPKRPWFPGNQYYKGKKAKKMKRYY